MLLHYSAISSVRLEQRNGIDIISKSSSTHPLSIRSLEREFNALTDLKNRGVDFGLLPGQSNDFNVNEKSILFKRKGTHDLSDLGHDLTVAEFFSIVANLSQNIDEIHRNGYVHRDIKPGNIMVSQDAKGRKKYAGLVDFGMALRINRIQNEDGTAGGTRPFYHRSQLDKDERATPGQDWFGLALTCLYFMRPSIESMEAEINSSLNGVVIDFNQIAGISQKTVSLDDLHQIVNSNFFQHLTSLIVSATSTNSNLIDLTNVGKGLAEAAQPFLDLNSPRTIINKDKPLPMSGQGVIKHDLLLIIDETNSLASEIDRIKSTIEDTVSEFDGTMDLRVDLWTVRDYARRDVSSSIKHQTVRKVGYRLTARTMAHAIDEIAADAVQHDEAEAYEMAFEEALGNKSQKVKRPSRWIPRKNTTRSVVLAGDAYAHGWLRRNWWAGFYGECKTNDKYKQLKTNFQTRHPSALANNNAEKAELERRRGIEKSKTDEFGSRVETVPDGMGGVQFRPNLQKVVDRLRDSKETTIHTICLGNDTVAKSYMKFVALHGDGVMIDGKGDFADALIGIIASPDPLLYKKILSRNSISQTAVQNLAPLTTFVLN